MPAFYLKGNVFKIRRYRAADYRTVKELYLAGNRQMGELFTKADLQELLASPTASFGADLDDIEGVYINSGGDFLVGSEGNDIIVTGAIKKLTEETGELKRLRVRRDRQRQGYGETMMKALEERAGELGYKELILDTLASNLPAQRLFEKYSYREMGQEKKGPFKLIIYGKKLGA